MITLDKMGGLNSSKRAEFIGKSTDEKFISKEIPNGSSYFEIDTGDIYLYDLENQRWCLQ